MIVMPQLSETRASAQPSARPSNVLFALLLAFSPVVARAEAPVIIYVDQGSQWNAGTRSAYYKQDQGSRLIPLAWLRALRQGNGKPFLENALQRYGYLSNPDPANTAGLPIGFSNTASAQGQMVGMACSACHVRQINVGTRAYRIDGAPAIADFQTFAADLD